MRLLLGDEERSRSEEEEQRFFFGRIEVLFGRRTDRRDYSLRKKRNSKNRTPPT
jgi:hypothetical protein